MESKMKSELQRRCLKSLPLIKKQIRRYIVDYNDQCDVLQDVISTAFKNIHKIKAPYNVEGWLTTIARNHSLQWLKRNSRIMEMANPEILSDDSLSTDYEVSRDEYEQLLGGINKLSYILRIVIQMKYFTHNSVKDISNILNIPEGTVKRRLHVARNKLRKEFLMNTELAYPKIIVTPKDDAEIIIKRLGFGLNFGSPLAGVGDVEVYEAYEYPGRILVNKFASEVTRKTKIMGKEVLEVHDISTVHENKKGTEKYYYYHVDENALTMVFRIINFSDKLKIDIDKEDLLEAINPILRSGEQREEEDNTFILSDVVDLTVGDKSYRNVIRQRISSDDYHGRCYMEKFYNSEGREILHRNYIGANWKMGDYVKWEKWKDSPEVKFNGEIFRLWFEFVLVDNYNNS